jgi:hypothetical protein
MIKFLDILKESDDNIFIPRRTKEEKDKKLLFRTYRKIRDYIKNGSQGDLNLSGSPIEFLPKNLTEVNGDLLLYRCKNLKSLPSGFKVGGTLDLRDTNILELPPDLEVGGSIYLLRTPIEKLPNNLTVNGRLDLEGCKNIRSLPNGLKIKYSLDIQDSNIEELPSDLNVGRDLVLHGTPLSRNYSRDEIRKIEPLVKGYIFL